MTTDGSPILTDRRTYISTVGAGTIAALAGCASNGDGGDGTQNTTTGSTNTSPGDIVIGANHPLSGGLSRAGTAMSRGARLAAMHVNDGTAPGFADGGIPSLDGAKLTVETGDNEGSQELGGEVEQQLIDAGAVAITGCYSSPVTVSAVQVAEREQVPHVIDVSVANRILQQRQMDYAFRVSANANRFANNYAEFVPNLVRNNDQTYGTAGIVYLNNAFGQSIHETLQSELPKNDVEVLFSDAYSFGQSSLDTEATKAKQNDPDALIFVGYGNGGIKLMNSLQNVNYKPSLLTGCSTPTFTSEQVISEIGKFVNGGVGNNYDFNFSLDWTDTIVADYREEFGDPLEVVHTSMSYTVVITIAHAIEEAGSSDPSTIKDALNEITVTDHPAAMPEITFREDGENANAIAPIHQVQNLEADLVYPQEYAQAKAQF